MRKITSIGLVVIILYSLCGFYLLQEVLLYHIRSAAGKEIKAGIRDKDLTLLVLTPGIDKEIMWTRPGKEFSFRGNIYDVVKVRTEGGKTYLFCFKDVREKRLLTNCQKHRDMRKEPAKKLKRTYPSQYLPQHNLYMAYVVPQDISFIAPGLSYQSIVINIPFPPPKKA
jgi:hypothetical protein